MNLRLATMTAVVALMLFTPIAGNAQDIASTAPGTVAPSGVDTGSKAYTQQKLDQMLAPIALYPDQLVAQILMASTFPRQIAEAARWLDNPHNAALKGEALVAALQRRNWDPSVKSITAFPAIVRLLSKNIGWTNSLGVAFSRQQTEVMAQIQFLRHQAQKAGNLTSNDKIVCRDDGTDIVIASADPTVVYAPHYNPAVVYGTWPWAAYPPVYFSPGYYRLGPIGAEVAWAWGPAWPIVPALWGWYGVNWGTGGGIYVNGGAYSQIAYRNAVWGGGNWQHPGGAISHGGFGGTAGSVGSAVVGGRAFARGHAGGNSQVRSYQGGGGHRGVARASSDHQGGGNQHGGGKGGGGGHRG